MPMREVKFDQWVAAPIERVFRFFADPDNLPRLTPSYLHLRVEAIERVPLPGTAEGNVAGPGSKVTLSFRPAFSPVRLRHVAVITQFEWLSHFQDEFSNWQMDWSHRHEFAREPHGEVEGTLVRDIVRLKLLFGAFAFPLVAKPMLDRMFAFRQRKLEDLMRSGAIKETADLQNQGPYFR